MPTQGWVQVSCGLLLMCVLNEPSLAADSVEETLPATAAAVSAETTAAAVTTDAVATDAAVIADAPAIQEPTVVTPEKGRACGWHGIVTSAVRAKGVARAHYSFALVLIVQMPTSRRS